MARNNELKETGMKNSTYYFDDIMNVNVFNSKNIKVG